MKYVILVGLIVLCIVLMVSLVRSVLDFKNKKKVKQQEIQKKENSVDVNDSSNRND